MTNTAADEMDFYRICDKQ